MKLLRQAGIITGLCFLGELLHAWLRLPIPGNVLGMLILFGCLCAGIIKLEMIAELSDFLLDHLAFFFIPAGVGVIACLGVLRGQWLAVLGICLVTTALVMLVTGHVVQWVKRGAKR
ncbi:holin-like protein [Hydrogenispora ethanolica]|jgi:holin-like protein|uniref:Holin-like protein n=1 Tax=Hydrogenispora ethanolica TaxID=1082276 RepID=A0A4R1SBC4_HYDET|nr:CidA/LrgA family protein [Hydrogenispora ethanolica]TCL76778.1 holin-like protein [Hydrogenispora ethanolica]